VIIIVGDRVPFLCSVMSICDQTVWVSALLVCPPMCKQSRSGAFLALQRHICSLLRFVMLWMRSDARVYRGSPVHLASFPVPSAAAFLRSSTTFAVQDFVSVPLLVSFIFWLSTARHDMQAQLIAGCRPLSQAAGLHLFGCPAAAHLYLYYNTNYAAATTRPLSQTISGP
jgi:hypothetical protein